MSKIKSIKTLNTDDIRSKMSDEEALSVTAEVLHGLLLKSINTLMLTTEEDEEIKVHIVNMGKKQELINETESIAYLADKPPIDEDVSINEQ